MKTKNLFTSVILVILFFSGCVSQQKYIEPLDTKNSAKLLVNKKELLSNYTFPMEIEVQLDDKIINEYDYPEMAVLLSEGIHDVILNISAFYHGGIVKYNTTKKYEIYFKSGETYVLLQ